MISSVNLDTYSPPTTQLQNKYQFGEVNTPFYIIQQMIDMIPALFLENPYIQWIDPACGCGHFPMVLYKRLMLSLHDTPKPMRSVHILKEMLTLVELNRDHYNTLRTLFGPNAHIHIQDYVSWFPTLHKKAPHSKMIIIGNPPYNTNGIKKVPTNTTRRKKQDGQTIWTDFIHHSLQIMNRGDFLVMLVPSIWMKSDHSSGIYTSLTKYKLHKIRTYTNTETASIFKKQAQTPICMFFMEKVENDGIVHLYNRHTSNYEPYSYSVGEPVPLCHAPIVAILRPFVKQYGTLCVKKTNMPRKHIILSSFQTPGHSYKNVRTCRIVENHPAMIYEYSNEPCAFYGVKKLILAHKMYGYPFFDASGTLGICNRDNYVIAGYTDTEFKKIQTFLSTKIALCLFETTRYRMKYLEKYVFEFIPDITRIPHFPTHVTDDTITEFFGL